MTPLWIKKNGYGTILSYERHMRSEEAFTLVELLVVISIIGVLSTMAMVALNFARGQARQAKALHDIDAIYGAVKMLENDTGEWPGHQLVEEVTVSGANEIWDLTAPQAGIAATDGAFLGWTGPYLVNVPVDPWGNDYFWDSDYTVDGMTRVVIGSFGPNGVGQNLYDSDDIIKIIR